MRKMIEVKAGENIRLNDYGFSCIPKINALWTIYNEDEMLGYYTYNPDNGMRVEINNLESLKPIHKHGTHSEEQIYDWDIDYKENLLHYYSRLVEQGEKVKILIDYEEMKCSKCPNWCIGGFDEHYCGITGLRKCEDFACGESEKNVFDHGDVY